MNHRVTSLGLVAIILGGLAIAARPDPPTAAEYVNRANASVEKCNYDRAIANCDQALALDPESAAAYSLRGRAWALKSNYEKALADVDQALAINPKVVSAYAADYWNLFNNIGVYLWKQAQQQDVAAARAEAAGDLETANACRQKSVSLKEDATALWNRGIAIRPTAADIQSNVGYAYSEANDLDKAEEHLTKAVELKPISPRPHNNLGRVLMQRSRQCERDARDAEAKGETDPAAAARAKQLKIEAKAKLDAAIKEFDRAVELDPAMLEARLNLGEVYLSLNDPEKAEVHFLDILKLQSDSIRDRETISTFSEACFGLARVALARNNPDEAIKHLQQALERNRQNLAALQLLAIQRFERGEYREGQKLLWTLLDGLPPRKRQELPENFIIPFEDAHKTAQVVQSSNFFAWAFATNPDSKKLDPNEALKLAQHAVAATQQKDPLSLDTLAAALAASGQYDNAAQAAKVAIDLATSQGNKPLGDAISQRLQLYQQGKPYQCDLSGNDRP